MIDVRANCRRILDRIHNAAARSGRDPSSVRLIAVTKTVPAERVREAVECGITDLGENRLQETLSKQAALRDLRLTWHFIGHLQTNKAKKAAETFNWIQSIDRLDLAEKLDRYATSRMPVLIEVELGNEKTKSGVPEDGLAELMEGMAKARQLEVRGFMAIPPLQDDPENCRPYFARLRGLQERFKLPELSMGMSHDFEVAIAEGSTMVRVGTALFGDRA